MPKLKHTFKTDILFKMLFTKNQHLLKNLVSQLLKLPVDSISQFEVKDPEITPDFIGNKYCRLDILMTVDKQQVNLEIQVENRGDYPDRVLYYWAKLHSGALQTGEEYAELPRTIIISIINFTLFDDCTEFHSEFQMLEVTRKTLLSDKQVLHFFELPKLPKEIDKDDLLQIWLALFKADTEEELKMIDELGVNEINEIVTAYHKLAESPEFRELERVREKARNDEASALGHARRCGEAIGEKRGEKRASAKWKKVVADKDAEIDNLQKQLAELTKH